MGKMVLSPSIHLFMSLIHHGHVEAQASSIWSFVRGSVHPGKVANT